MTLSEHLSQLNPTRRALLAAGTVTLAISMALSIAPAMAAGNPNSGTVKIHDASTNTDPSGNDPHVCTFTVVFTGFDAGATATWTISQAAPTGSAQMTSGTYTADANGADETGTMTEPAGHYTLDWTADGANGKHKTFWVDPTCASQDPGNTGGDTGSTGSGSDQTGDTGSTGSGSDQSGSTGSDQSGSTGSDQTGNTGSDQSGNTGSDQTGNTGNTGSDKSGQTPEGGVKGVTGSSTDGTTSSLPNTSFEPPSPSPTSLLTVLGLLLIVAAHPFIRRSAHADRA